jgi:hypothetical protein
MKITKARLKQIIKEELENLSTEMVDPRAPRHLSKKKDGETSCRRRNSP